jgi:hypothetical protein
MNKINTDLGDLSPSEFSDGCIKIFNLLTLNSGIFSGLPEAMGAIDAIPPGVAGNFGPMIFLYNKVRLGPDYDGKTEDTQAYRNVLQKALTKNGNWLNTFCDGDPAKLAKTGYPRQKAAEAQGVLPQTVCQVVSEAGTGKMDFFIDNLKGYSHVRYGMMFTGDTNPETNPALWTFYYSSQKNGSIAGFEIGKTYKFVSFGMGTEREIVYSEVILVKAL